MAKKTEQFILDQPLDPEKITLRRFLEMRAAGHISSGKASKDTIGDTIRNNKAFARLLDEPLIAFLDAGLEHHTSNPLFIASQEIQARAEKTVASRGEGDPEGVNARRRLYSHVDAIEQNILHQLDLPDNRDLKKRYDNLIPRMTDGVVNPKKPGPLAERFRFRHENVGLLKKALLEHVLANPKDEHIVRALFMQIDLGFRPGEIERMPVSAYKQPTGSGRFKGTVPGLYIPPSMTKMNAEINIPMSPDIFAQFKANMGRHRRLIGEGGVDALFIDNDGKPIKEGDMTRILKSIEVRAPDGTGLMFDVETGKEIFTLPRAYLLRNMQITAAASLGIDAITSGAMRGRAYRGEASIEVGYQGKVPGSNTAQEMQPHATVHAYFRAQLTDALGFSQDTTLAPDQDIIGAWMASGGKIDTSAGTIGMTTAVIPVNQQPEISMKLPYNAEQIGNLSPVIVDAPEELAPPVEVERTDEDKASIFRRLMSALDDPKLKGAGGAAILSRTLTDDGVSGEDVADFAVQTALEEGATTATAAALKALRVAPAAANPAALSVVIAGSMTTPVAGDLTAEQVEEQRIFEMEQRAADNIRPGGSGGTKFDSYPAIGTAEGAAETRRTEMFMEPDMGEGSPADIEEVDKARIEDMSRIAIQDSAMRNTDETPGFMAR